MKLTIVVTVYNERDTILRAIQQAKAVNVDKQIIVVDNGSTDGTREILRGLNDSSIDIVYQPKNCGYGCSVITGMRMAEGQFLYVHNSDLEYDASCVYEMLELSEKENLDAIFGSRLYVRKGESKFKILKERPFYLGTIIVTFLTNIFYNKDFTDVIGNRFYRASFLRMINPEIFGIGFDFEVVSKLCKFNANIKEIPVGYKARTKGKKIKIWDIIPAVWQMLKIKIFCRPPVFARAEYSNLLKQGRVKNILVVRNDRFGEFLLSLPVIAVLKKKFPEADITLVVSRQNEVLAKRVPHVSRVLAWDNSTGHFLFEKISFFAKLKKIGGDISFVLNPSKEFNLYTFIAGVPYRVGYNRKWGFLLNIKIDDTKSQGLRHEIDYNLDLLKAAQIQFDSKDISFPLDIRTEDLPEDKICQLGITQDLYIFVHPWASNPEKEWPIDNYSELVKKMLHTIKTKIAVIGGQQEAARAEEFSRKLSILNLAGKLNLIELAALLKFHCRFLVTNDSGPMHLAAILGVPTLCLFRMYPDGVSARRWGPRGNRHIVIENEDIHNISIEEVFNAASKML